MKYSERAGGHDHREVITAISDSPVQINEFLMIEFISITTFTYLCKRVMFTGRVMKINIILKLIKWQHDTAQSIPFRLCSIYLV